MVVVVVAVVVVALVVVVVVVVAVVVAVAIAYGREQKDQLLLLPEMLRKQMDTIRVAPLHCEYRSNLPDNNKREQCTCPFSACQQQVDRRRRFGRIAVPSIVLAAMSDRTRNLCRVENSTTCAQVGSLLDADSPRDESRKLL